MNREEILIIKNSSAYFSLIIFEWVVLDLKKMKKINTEKIKQTFS